VSPHVLGDFAKSEEGWLADLLDGIADGAPALAAGDGAGFLDRVARRRAPPEPHQVRPPHADAPPAPDDRSLLQKLADRFR
jgi:PTH1 family peptidyl-tRNA hydrolase